MQRFPNLQCTNLVQPLRVLHKIDMLGNVRLGPALGLTFEQAVVGCIPRLFSAGNKIDLHLAVRNANRNVLASWIQLTECAITQKAVVNVRKRSRCLGRQRNE